MSSILRIKKLECFQGVQHSRTKDKCEEIQTPSVFQTGGAGRSDVVDASSLIPKIHSSRAPACSTYHAITTPWRQHSKVQPIRAQISTLSTNDPEWWAWKCCQSRVQWDWSGGNDMLWQPQTNTSSIIYTNLIWILIFSQKYQHGKIYISKIEK